MPVKDPDIHADILYTEKIVALLHVNHPLAQNKFVFLSDLKNEEFILFPRGCILQKIVEDACKQAGFLPNITSEGEEMDAIKGLVSAGIGVSLLPESTFYEGTTPLSTVTVPVKMPEITRTIGIITPKSRALAPSEQIFYEFSKNCFPNLVVYTD